MKKRGISDVVSTVLIILLVVAAIAIVGAIVLRMINSGGGQINSAISCDSVDLTPVKCTYNKSTTFGLFKVKLPTSLTLSNVTLIFDNSAGSIVKGISGSQVNALETDSFVFTSDNSVNPPLRFSLSASMVGSDGKNYACAQSNKIECSKPEIAGVPTLSAPIVNGTPTFTPSSDSAAPLNRSVSACTPLTLAAACAGNKCGSISDGCGGSLACTTVCSAPQTCGGGGIANICGIRECFDIGLVPEGCTWDGMDLSFKLLKTNSYGTLNVTNPRFWKLLDSSGAVLNSGVDRTTGRGDITGPAGTHLVLFGGPDPTGFESTMKAVSMQLNVSLVGGGSFMCPPIQQDCSVV